MWANTIRKRRKELHKQQVDINSNGIITARILGMLERNEKDIETLETRQVTALLDFLEWTPEQFYRETKIKLPGWITPMSLELQLLRENLGLNHQEMGNKIGINEAFEYELETRQKNFKDLTLESLKQLFALSKIEWNEGIKRIQAEAKTHLNNSISNKPNFIIFPVINTISVQTSNNAISNEITIIPRNILHHYQLNEQDVKVFKVSENSIISETVRLSRKNIAPDDLIAVTSKVKPQSNDIIAIWLPEKETLIIKTWLPEMNNNILYPANLDDIPINTSNNEPVELLGIVFWRSSTMC